MTLSRQMDDNAFPYYRRLQRLQECRLAPGEETARRAIPQTMWEHLQTIPDSAFEEALAGALDGGQIDAFLARRKRLVEHIGGLIAENGEEKVVGVYQADPAPGEPS